MTERRTGRRMDRNADNRTERKINQNSSRNTERKIERNPEHTMYRSTGRRMDRNRYQDDEHKIERNRDKDKELGSKFVIKTERDSDSSPEKITNRNAGKKRKKVSLNKNFKKKALRTRNILSLVSFILVVVFIIFLGIMNILPNKYLYLISGVLILVDLIGICFINVYKKTALKVIGYIILGLITIGSSIGIYYLSSTNNFLNNSFGKKFSIEKNTYYVITASSNNYKESDISDKVSVYKETPHLDKALKKLNKKYEVTTKSYDDVGLVFDNVLNKTDKFMLVEKSSYEIVLSVPDKYKKENFTILYEFDIYTKKKNNGNANTKKFNIYLGGKDFIGLMDFNMIITANTKTHQLLLTSVPRDYYIEVYGKNQKDKLSFMSAYGSDTNKASLSKLFDTNIDYSVTVNTDSLVEIVDYVGGIEFCSDYSYTTTHAMINHDFDDSKGKKLTIKKGCQKLNGIEALTVARERNAFPGRDRVRQENCQKILVAILKKLATTDSMIHYNETLNTIGSLYETDIPKTVISNISKDIINNGNNWKITTQSVDGTDGHDKVHLSNVVDWVMYPDQKTVVKAQNKIKETLK